MKKQKSKRNRTVTKKGKPACPPKNDPSKDMVMTPPKLAREIIRHFKPRGRLLDPAAGDGAFLDNFPGCKGLHHYCEITLGIDFLKEEFHGDTGYYDWCITNPPWSLFKEFLFKAMECCDNIVFLASMTHFTTKARLREIRARGWKIKEFLVLDTPKEWPQGGFQLVAGHLERAQPGDELGWDIAFEFDTKA